MRGTLSHSFGRSARGESNRIRSDRSSFFLLFLGALAAFALATGCNRVETESADPSGSGESDAPWPPADFAWPVDPEHPVVRVDIVGIAGEGTLWIELMPELAPNTVAQVMELVGEGYYDGTTFHRVIPSFMIQGGDPNSRDNNPTNDGQGRSPRLLPDEFSSTPFVRGVVGMGNTGRKDSNSAQFFIMQTGNPSLDGRYTAIGRVVRGMELVDAISEIETDRNGRWGPKDRPIENVMMEFVSLEGVVSALGLPDSQPQAPAKTNFARRAIEKAEGAAVAIEQAAEARTRLIDGPSPAPPAAQ